MSKLDSNDILIAEFNYAAQTAFQSNEDRVRVFTLLIANVASIGAAIMVPEVSQVISQGVFALILLALSFAGIFSLLHLSRLRLAWVDSVKTMNRIKDFYVEQEGKELSEAFRWKTSTIPKPLKINSLAFLFSAAIIVVNTVSFGTAIFLLTYSWLLSILLSILLVILQFILLKLFLRP